MRWFADSFCARIARVRRRRRSTGLFVVLALLAVSVALFVWFGFARRWVSQSSGCRINFTPTETFGELSSVWNFQPAFVHQTDFCNPDLIDPERTRIQKNPSSESKFLIPRLIHQIWDTDSVPEIYINWTRSWLRVNPGWQHWFWTLSDGRDLVSRHYPSLLQTWDNYQSPINRADALRYFIMHRYGGVYVDVDYEALRPIDSWIRNFRCIFSEEPYEHAFLLYKKVNTFVSTAFIACSPGHPLLQAAIDRLTQAASQFRDDVMLTAGPFMFNLVLEKYTDTYVASQREREPLDPNCVAASVTVVPPYYFQPVYSQADVLQTLCSNESSMTSSDSRRPLSRQARTVCAELRRTNFSSSVNRVAYAVHWWHGAWFRDNWKTSKRLNVFDSVPGVEAANRRALSDNAEAGLTTPVNWCEYR